MATLKPIFPQVTSPPQASAEVLVNEALKVLQAGATYGYAYQTSSGLTWGYYGGRWGGFSVAAGTFTLTNAADNYIVVERATGVTTCSTSGVNWANATDYAHVYKVTTAGSVVTAVEDHRGGPGGIIGGDGTGVGGGSGAVTGLSFTASTTTTDSDPGTGVLRWNNATQASATILYIDNADADSTSLATLWASLQSGAFLKITDAADEDVWQLWKVTATPVNGTGYYKFTVSLQAQEGGNIANAAAILLDVDASAAPATPIVQLQSIPIACSDEATALTTGTAKVTFHMPFDFTLAGDKVMAELVTPQASGSIFTVDINEAGSSILSTKLTIDNTEETSFTAATPAVVSDSSLAKGAKITVDIDQIGDGTATGLKVWLIGWPT